MLERVRQTTRSAMTLPFRPVDIAAQTKAYRLEQRGQEDGAANRPETDSNQKSLAEQEIQSAIHAERERCVADLTAHLRAERDALAQLQTAMDIAGMRQAAGEASANLVAIAASFGSTLARTRQAATQSDGELAEFRARNRLTRAARQPSNRALTITLMVFLIVVEGVVNAWFFAGGSDFGLLGGVMLAAMFSAVNVSLGAFNGWVPLRWAHHRNLGIKLVGFAIFPMFLACAVVLNGFVAHYRDAAQAAPDAEPLRPAWSGLLRTPFDLLTIESWLLFALGVACAGFAIVKGFAMDDPYPGYGSHDRRRTAACSAYEDARLEAMDQAAQVRDDFTGELREKIETLRGSSSQRQQLLSARARNISDFGSHEAHLTDAAQQLLTIYQSANRAARSTPPPAGFAQAFSFPEHALDRPAVRALLEDHGLEVNAERLIGELDELRRDVLGKYETMVKDLALEPAA